jgi:hypothetical protein
MPAASAFGQGAAGPTPHPAPSPPPSAEVSAEALPPPTGGKLVLKDGTFQLVREYEVDGDRVRYYSIDQHDWEEMPAALIDWEATQKAAAEDARRKKAIIAKVHAEEAARTSEPLDVDASIEIAKNVFLPAGEGVWAFDGDKVSKLAPVDADIKFSKTQMLKQVLIPIPIVPTRHTVSLKGTRAKFRMDPGQIEFYMRYADGHEPEVQLIEARIHGDKRDLENLDEMFKEQASSGLREVKTLRWQIARGVYKFTVIEPSNRASTPLLRLCPAVERAFIFGILELTEAGAAQRNKPAGFAERPSV